MNTHSQKTQQTRNNISPVILWASQVAEMLKKKSACNAGDPGSIPGSGRSLREGNGNPLQYSCLEDFMDRPWGCKEWDTTEQLTL